MKKLLVTLTAVLVSASTFAQGTIRFTTRDSGRGVDVPVYAQAAPTGLGSIAGAQAQLFLVGAGGALTPIGTPVGFRPQAGAAQAYVVEPLAPVEVTGVAAGQNATITLRAWVGAASYDAASPLNRGQSPNNITVTLGGDPGGGAAPLLPAILAGLQGFTVPIVPEPSVLALGLFGAAALLYRRRK